ncbi:MAG: MgtC/SapB family protein [Opitutales bacterium]
MDTSLQSLILSASLGALIGLIRQWGEQQDAHKEDYHFAGLRTFVLWALIGYSSAFISEHYVPLAFVAAILVVGLHLVLFGVFSQKQSGIGFTTTAAAMVTLFLGALVFWDQLPLAVMLAAITMLVLGLKQKSHSWTRHFTGEDIRSTLQFVAVTGVVLPLVPDQGYGPYGAINPYSLWLMVVLISGLGFVGYILMRLLGPRAGVALAGLVGGLASSTATTLAFSRESKIYPEFSSGFALAIIMACTIMLGRVIILLGFIHPAFIPHLWLPFSLIALPGLAYALWLGLTGRKTEKDTDLPDLKNPLGLSIAIKFALLYGIISFLVAVLSESNLTDGLLALSFLSGLTDMDAIALSMTKNLKDGTVAATLATQALILAAIANTLLKGGLAVALGSRKLKRHIMIALGTTILAGCAVFFFAS